MPLHEYHCSKCGKVFEKIQKFSNRPKANCPECGAPGKRQLSAPAIRFKGTGWYVTDYANKAKSKEEKAEAKAEAKDGEKKEPPASKKASKDATKDSKPKKSS